MSSPLRLRCYEVRTPETDRARFMTLSSLRYLLSFPLELFPDSGQSYVFNDLWPFGSLHRWERVKGGMTLEELIDSNLTGKRDV